jgi:tRNA-2-methylthio-N6-dimethylallyladenosine synthase
MKREHTRQWFLDRINEYRTIVSEGSVSTDIIVGFPGETDEDFELTKSLIKAIGFDFTYIFKYSRRPGTPAWKLEDDVSEHIKRKRHQELLALQKEISRDINSTFKGKVVEVLVEGFTGKNVSKAHGRTRGFKRVALEADSGLIGKFVNVQIDDASGETLLGHIVPDGI